MKRKTLTISALSVVILSGLVLASAAVAKQTKPPDNEVKIFDQVSSESYTAMRDVRFARLAIFDGQTTDAVKLLDDARDQLTKAKKNAPTVTVTVDEQEKLGDKTVEAEDTTTNDYVPIDAWLGLTENYVSTPEHDAKIKQANEHIKNGERDKAIDLLRETGIEVSATRVLMPIESTETQVDTAIDLMKQQKYYEANLALKSAEDGIVMDTNLIVEPDQGKNATDAKANAKSTTTDKKSENT